MARRPRPGEDDLDAMLAEFESGSSRPAATVVSKRPAGVPPPLAGTADTKKPRSKFSRERTGVDHRQQGEEELPPSAVEETNQLVLGGIVERNVEGAEATAPSIHLRDFPPVIKLAVSGGDDKPSKRSLFSQQFMKMKSGLSSATDSVEVADRLTAIPARCLPGFSHIVSGDGLGSCEEAAQLHQENLRKLKSMTEQEIREAQEQLRSTLSPDLLEFIQSRRSNRGKTCRSASPPTISAAEAMDVADNLQTHGALVDDSKLAEVVKAPPVPDLLNRYPNMNRDEPAKREWMAELPVMEVVAGKLSGGYVARFGFDGRLLDPNLKADIQSGLYHHGEEPERAGYSLQEMFIFLRSTNTRQRILGLDLISALLDQYWTGVMDDCFAENLVGEMLSCGLLSLVRAAMDEREESLVFAATNCLASLISPQGEEAAFDWVNCWGGEQPVLGVQLPEEERTEGEEITDHQLAQLDTLAALLRMDILPRLRYLLTVLRPGPGTVLASLRILVRLCRHSLGAARQVAACPGLLSTVLANFLPPSLPLVFSTSTLYGAPVWLAAKLCRVLLSWSRDLARMLCTEYDLASILMVYLTVEPSEAAIPSREAAQLCIEAYRVWTQLLRYGLATEQFLDLYPLLVRQLLYFVEKVDITAEDRQFDLDIGCSIFSLLTCVVGAAHSKVLDWRHVADLRAPSETCCRKWLAQLSRVDGELVITSAANLAGACLHFLAVFYTKLHSRQSDAGRRAGDTSGLAQALVQFCTTAYFRRVFEALSHYSGYLSTRPDNPERAPSQLPAGWSVLRQGAVQPLLLERSPLHMVAGLCRIISTLRYIGVEQLGAVDQTVIHQLQPYVGQLLLAKPPRLASNWFSRFEARLLFWATSLTFWCDQPKAAANFEQAILLCGLLHSPDELLLQELFDKAVFSADALSAETLAHRLTDQLSLDRPLQPSSVACAGESQPPLSQILSESLDNISLIKETYRTRLLSRGVVTASHAIHNLVPGDIGSLCFSSGTILANDWPYWPLLEAYNKAQSAAVASTRHLDADINKRPATPCQQDIRNCLAWLLLCGMDTLPPRMATAHYYRLATVFLCSSDLFLDPLVHQLLLAHLTVIVTAGSTRPDLALAVPGLTSGHEFYLQLLDQFQAVSYGDQLFALYLVLPLSMLQPPAFRRSLWTERPEIVRLISLRPEHLSPGWLSEMLQPPETSADILAAYLRALVDGTLAPQRNPLLHHVALHHVRSAVAQGSASVSPDVEEFATMAKRTALTNPALKALLHL